MLAATNPTTAEEFADYIDSCVDALYLEHKLPEEEVDFLRRSLLESAYPALAHFRRGCPEKARKWIQTVLKMQVTVLTGDPELVQEELELQRSFTAAVSARLRAGKVERQGRQIVRRLMASLHLSQDEMGRAFNVSGETIRRWERGKVEIPKARLAELVSSNAALDRLLDLFLPESLPQVVRRKAEAFGDECALDWILRGRIADAAGIYEATLEYQG